MHRRSFVFGEGIALGHDAYSVFVARVLFPLHESLKGHDTTRHLRHLERSQWWDRGTLEKFQAGRLRHFLKRIEVEVPYYRDVFRRTHFDPTTLQSVTDLSALPLLTKSEIRAHRDAFLRPGARGLIPNSTGGSTGEPLQFFVGKGRVTADVASRRRAMRWWGVDIGDPEIVLWGSPIEITRQDRMRQMRDWLFRSRLLSAAAMNTAGLERYVLAIQRARPVQIFSHASALCEVAAHAERTGRSLSNLGTRVVFVTSEELYDYQREQLERVFGCPVANGYGARDAGFIAQECPSGGMHVSIEDVVVEIVDESGAVLPSGEPGEIVVTHLKSADFPFVRYRTGDIGVMDGRRCPCGRGLPLLREIHGRADDLLLSRSGARVPGQMVVHFVRSRPEIKTFKIVQEAEDRIRIQVVAPSGVSPAATSEITRGVEAVLGKGMQVDIEMVDSIPREKSGKYRTVVSRVGRSPALEAEHGGVRG